MSVLLRRTKIVATLGPSTDDPAALADLVRAGVDVVRLNFSHGVLADHARRVGLVREAARQAGRYVGVLGDLQGPKIRIDRFVGGKVQLKDGADFTLDASLAPDAGTEQAVGIAYKRLPSDVSAGDVLLLNDGQIGLQVKSIDGPRILTRVIVGGELGNNKGINRQGGGLSAGALTDKDREDIVNSAKLKVDFLAVSFARDAADMDEARKLLRDAGGHALLIAKIERAEAIKNLSEVARASDGVMVARGDLGVEMGYAELAGLQKQIIQEARHQNRLVIMATQMMESMIVATMPTRAEVSDVANAVMMDGSDAVMLSAETASGRHPAKVVEAMAQIIVGAEKYQVAHRRVRQRSSGYFGHTDEAIAAAVMYTANHLHVKAIVALTESGSTPLWMSRVRSDIPIYALTRHESTRSRMCLYRGVYPVAYDVTAQGEAFYFSIFRALLELKLVGEGDSIILTKGELSGVSGGTNSMQILKVVRA